MSSFDNYGTQSGHIQQADTIYNGPVNSGQVIIGDNNTVAPPTYDAAKGLTAVSRHDYATARHHLSAAVADDPSQVRLRYWLALALLDGRRPHMHSAQSIAGIERCLSPIVEQVPEAMALALLIADDYRLAWQRNDSAPASVLRLVDSVQPDRAREIVEHVPAPESRVWRLLYHKSGGE